MCHGAWAVPGGDLGSDKWRRYPLLKSGPVSVQRSGTIAGTRWQDFLVDEAPAQQIGSEDVHTTKEAEKDGQR